MSDFKNDKPKQVCYIYKNGFKSNDKQPDFKSTIKITPDFLQQMVNFIKNDGRVEKGVDISVAMWNRISNNEKKTEYYYTVLEIDDYQLKKEMASQSPLFKQNRNFGGLYSTDEVRIEPRLAIPAVAKYLQSIGIDFLWKEEVLDFSHQYIVTQKRKIQFKKLIMAPGNHLKGLGRDVFEKRKVESSKLHMLRIMPKKKIKLPGGIMADLTLMRYPGYENLPSKKKLDKVIKKKCRAELDNGIHVIVVQGKDGSLTIGDSHHYTNDTHYPFENEAVDNLILNKFDQVLPIGKYDVIERWVGEYPSGKKDYLDYWIDKNICIANVTTGIGMSTGFAFAEDVVNKLY